jgi:dipeptidyl aminopeptidase/acylaminoacyl peptidase
MDLRRNCYHSHIHIIPAAGGRIVRLTQGEHADSSPVFSPDGRHLAFVSNREQKANLWVIQVAGGEARRLTRFEAGAIHSPVWSPDGKEIAFVRRDLPAVDPEKQKLQPTYKHITRLHHRMDGLGFIEGSRWHLWKVAFPGGRSVPLTSGEHDNGQPVWSPDSKYLAFVSRRGPDADTYMENSDLFLIPRRGGQPRKVTRHKGHASTPAWSADGRYLYFFGNFAGPGEWLRHRTHVFRIPRRGGKLEDLTTLEHWPMNMVIGDVNTSFATFLLTYRKDGEERLALMQNERGSCRLYSLSASGGRLRPEMTGGVSILGASVLRATGQAAVVATEMMTAGDLFALTLDGRGAPRRLTHLNRRVLAGLDLTEPEETVFRNRGVRIQGWILKPPGFRASRSYPTILQIHGGPMCQYGYTFFHEMHLLAAQGYVVVFTNPRGSAGFGMRYMNCIQGRWGSVDYQDLMAVTDSMVRRRYVNRRRLGVIGGSYGGFMTTWVVGHTNRFRAAVTQRQLGSWLIYFASGAVGYRRMYEFGGTPWEKPMKYLRASPNFYADRIQTPLLIIHSENDMGCTIGQAEELFTYLKVQGKTVELVRFEGESHGLSRGGRPQNRLERLNRIVDWYRRYL